MAVPGPCVDSCNPRCEQEHGTKSALEPRRDSAINIGAPHYCVSTLRSEVHRPVSTTNKEGEATSRSTQAGPEAPVQEIGLRFGSPSHLPRRLKETGRYVGPTIMSPKPPSRRLVVEIISGWLCGPMGRLALAAPLYQGPAPLGRQSRVHDS